MAIPIIEPAPDGARQTEIIAGANDEQLENVRQHALGTMHAFSEAGNTAPSDYANWSAFVGKIEAEQRKRRERNY